MKARAWEAVAESLEHRASIFSIKKRRARSPLSGREHDFDLLESVDWVNIIALTNDGNIVLIRQYRHGTREITCEIPGGAVDQGETPLEAARRELEEETGYLAGSWELIGQVQPNPAFQTNTTYTYLARGASLSGQPQPDENEEIEVEEHPLNEMPRLVGEGTIKHALVLCAFFHLILKGELSVGP
jgi:8-oxo-dGTP pyrophosphatase MutT (NUDIX family)